MRICLRRIFYEDMAIQALYSRSALSVEELRKVRASGSGKFMELTLCWVGQSIGTDVSCF